MLSCRGRPHNLTLNVAKFLWPFFFVLGLRECVRHLTVVINLLIVCLCRTCCAHMHAGFYGSGIGSSASGLEPVLVLSKSKSFVKLLSAILQVASCSVDERRSSVIRLMVLEGWDTKICHLWVVRTRCPFLQTRSIVEKLHRFNICTTT